MAEHLRPEESILDAALDLAPEERGAFLDKACGGDANLRRLLEGLLQAHHRSVTPGQRFDASAQPLGSTLTQPTCAKESDRIGHYKLLQKIGEGGCGVVYLAEQQQPIRRRVALKVIKLGMDTSQ